eukprot:XP_001690116.1 predicted protein [Chlamydomonas reinhardtii]
MHHTPAHGGPHQPEQRQEAGAAATAPGDADRASPADTAALMDAYRRLLHASPGSSAGGAASPAMTMAPTGIHLGTRVLDGSASGASPMLPVPPRQALPPQYARLRMDTATPTVVTSGSGGSFLAAGGVMSPTRASAAASAVAATPLMQSINALSAAGGAGATAQVVGTTPDGGLLLAVRPSQMSPASLAPTAPSVAPVHGRGPRGIRGAAGYSSAAVASPSSAGGEAATAAAIANYYAARASLASLAMQGHALQMAQPSPLSRSVGPASSVGGGSMHSHSPSSSMGGGGGSVAGAFGGARQRVVPLAPAAGTAAPPAAP